MSFFVLDTIKSEEALVDLQQQKVHQRPRQGSETVPILTQKDSLANITNYKKNGSGSRSKNPVNNNIPESSSGAGASSKHKYLSHKSAGPPIKAILDGGAGLVGGQISSSREGSFRFLEHEEIEHTPNARKPQHKTVGDDTSSIQWSNNSDRLI